ncbi:Hypothetical protein AA314_01009 [Archangium gephyra]|uniref:Uncharacterized protein n=1 Tax=Archangium gephyra TaxID=48 RepID=A0AAC8TB90_9BACT|nr:Hypothetical protein AA314_01009 [Archangium gephyra]
MGPSPQKKPSGQLAASSTRQERPHHPWQTSPRAQPSRGVSGKA